jgi:8-oxo-dGTP pyrophosphatase MutT (NUDIX family)
MNEYCGWPVVTAENCFSVISGLGIKAWPKKSDSVPVIEWLKTATPEQVTDYNRLAPKSYAIKHMNPYNGEDFDAFRVEFKPYSLVFALIDNKYVAVTAEWKHGNDRITIVPVCGVAGKAEAHLSTLAERMAATAIREFREETGFELEGVEPLSSSNGMFYSVRNSMTQCFPYLGVLKTPLVKGPTKFDNTEHLAMVLFPLEEWLKLLEDNSLFDQHPEFGLEDCSRAATYAALRAMGRLKLV